VCAGRPKPEALTNHIHIEEFVVYGLRDPDRADVLAEMAPPPEFKKDRRRPAPLGK
jgi:hypothetical protein